VANTGVHALTSHSNELVILEETEVLTHLMGAMNEGSRLGLCHEIEHLINVTFPKWHDERVEFPFNGLASHLIANPMEEDGKPGSFPNRVSNDGHRVFGLDKVS